jgi:hypothetical protein
MPHEIMTLEHPITRLVELLQRAVRGPTSSFRLESRCLPSSSDL